MAWCTGAEHLGDTNANEEEDGRQRVGTVARRRRLTGGGEDVGHQRAQIWRRWSPQLTPRSPRDYLYSSKPMKTTVEHGRRRVLRFGPCAATSLLIVPG